MTASLFAFDVPADLLPVVTHQNRGYWEPIQERRLALPRCEACGRDFFPLSPRCPFCLSDRIAFAEAPRRGIVASWVRYHKLYYPWTGDALPYVVAMLDIVPGVRIPMLMNPGPPADPRIGDKVDIDFMETPSGFVLPVCAQRA